MITKEDLYYLYITKNLSQNDIGKIYGCSRKNISYYLKKYGISKEKEAIYRKFYKSDLTGEDIKRLVDKGMLIKDIIKVYGISRSAVSSRLKKAGINLTNHKAATSKQSKFMKTNNPFFDEKTKEKAIQNSIKTHKMKLKERRLELRVFDKNMTLKEYTKKARYLAYYHFGKGRKVQGNKVIDHKFSIVSGYNNKVPIAIISHPYNLRLISPEENFKKGAKNIITIDDLYEGAVFND